MFGVSEMVAAKEILMFKKGAFRNHGGPLIVKYRYCQYWEREGVAGAKDDSPQRASFEVGIRFLIF